MSDASNEIPRLLEIATPEVRTQAIALMAANNPQGAHDLLTKSREPAPVTVDNVEYAATTIAPRDFQKSCCFDLP